MSWMMAVGAGVSLAGNMLGNRSAKKGQQAQQRQLEQNAMNSLIASQNYGNVMQNRAPQMLEAYKPQYANVDTGFASTRVDPTTGQVSSTLNAPWANQRDMFMRNAEMASSQAPGMFGRGNQFFDQGRSQFDKALAFDPQSAAADRYGAAMKLLAPQDATNQQNLMQELYSKGGFGLTLGTPAAGGGTAAINPYLNTFENARNQRNAQLSWDSLNEGQRYVDSLFRRGGELNAQGGNMFNLGGNLMGLAGSQSGFAQGIEGQNQNALNQAGNWSNMFNANNRLMQDKYFGQLFGGQDMQYGATQDYFKSLMGGNAASGANNRSQMFSGIGNTVGSLIGGGGFNGMFKTGPVGGAAGGGMPAGSAYDLGPADFGMFPGQG